LAEAGALSVPGLWLVTRGAQPAGIEDEIALPGVAQSTLWGLGKVIAQEHPELNCIRADLDPAGSADEINALLQLIKTRDGEEQIALRRNQQLVPRLVISPHARPEQERQAQPLNGEPVQLVVSTRGALDGLEFRPLKRRSPGPGEVEIEVHATGLGFRDVLNVLGMVAQDTGPLGGECAGRIVAVGADVKSLQVGDEVIAVALGAFRSYLTLSAGLVARKPNELNLIEAATIPSAFLTAYYTLHRLAGLAAGDRVLIHAAAGGVGMAAVQLAQQAGAEVFATAGSMAKRALLRSLGVQHVMDSRSLDFADEILAITQGEGVNIVLNSLSDEFIPKSLSVLADGGCFLEIGKRGIWTEEQVAQQRPKVRYVVADLVPLTLKQPALIGAMLNELVTAFNAGVLGPLPLQAFPLYKVGDAFRYMAQARHVGKVVVTGLPPSRRGSPFAIRNDSAYLITGGLGGLGLAVAGWLVEQGARHLVLVGRSAPSKQARKALEKLEEVGAQVIIVQADIAQLEEIGRVMAEIEHTGPPLRGIVHAAGVLDDGVLLQQEWSRFEKVFAAKVEGSWNLHTLTRNRPLDFFVLFSSAVSLLGSAGQSNHVAANTFLDALAYYRHSQGLPALSIDWGPWSEVGAAASAKVAERLALRGIGMIDPRQGIQMLEQIMQRAALLNGQSSLCQVGVAPINWSRFRRRPTDQETPRFFAEMLDGSASRFHRQDAGLETSQVQIDLSRRLAETPPDERMTVLLDYVREQCLKVLGLEPTYTLDRRQPLHELGLDSLMAVELRNRLGAGLALQQKLPATLVFDYPTIEALAGYLAEKVLAVAQVDSSSPNGKEDNLTTLVEIESLSDEDAEALLLAKLELLSKGK
jgi:myxalamid-type polyketide synthase MxaB